MHITSRATLGKTAEFGLFQEKGTQHLPRYWDTVCGWSLEICGKD